MLLAAQCLEALLQLVATLLQRQQLAQRAAGSRQQGEHIGFQQVRQLAELHGAGQACAALEGMQGAHAGVAPCVVLR
jgi:hypothetical protein